MTDLSMLVLCMGLLLPISGKFLLAGVIPSESIESKSSICDKHKVICDPGWNCQAGFLIFPSEKTANCETNSDSSDCDPVDDGVTSKSVEVFCVREGELTALGIIDPRLKQNFSFLTALRQRSRRGACIITCRGKEDCDGEEKCVSNGCGRVCGKKPQ